MNKPQKVHHGADELEKQFYDSFERADLEQMMAVWAPDDHRPVCIHPHGPRLIGRTDIEASWKQILKQSPYMRLDIELIEQFQQKNLAIHYVNEHIYLGKRTVPEFTIIATNVYRLTADGWRIVLHHASSSLNSPDDAREQQKHKDAELTLH